MPYPVESWSGLFGSRGSSIFQVRERLLDLWLAIPGSAQIPNARDTSPSGSKGRTEGDLCLRWADPPVPGQRACCAGPSSEAKRVWARLIKHVYEVDPRICPRCSGTMKALAVIERPAVVRQILAHLGLPTTAPGLRAPADQPASRMADPPREWSYEPLG
jgi:hypothetical protein